MKRIYVVGWFGTLVLAAGAASGQDSQPAGATSASVAMMPDAANYYPSTSQTLGEAGLVKLHACYEPNGRILNVVVLESSGFPRLDDAALRLGRSVRIRPATLDGTPVSGCITVPVRFSAPIAAVPVAN